MSANRGDPIDDETETVTLIGAGLFFVNAEFTPNFCRIAALTPE